MPTPVRRQALLRQRLDSLVESFDVRSISPDPLELVLAYDDPRDQEVAGLLAAAFAYGRADIVVTNVGRVLRDMTPGPFAYLRESFTRKEASKRFAGFRHRFHKTPDLVLLLGRMARILEVHGSLGRLFEICYDPEDRDIGPSLARFAEAIIGDAGAAARKRLSYLITSPRDGSACKRMNLFLRWMIRRTAPDLGLWTFANPAKLVMPLDTHVHRITAFLGLNGRRSADWKAARLLTDRLARFAPSDPVRYDFAICRLGILDLCSRKRRREQCEVCLLNDVCRLRMV